MVGYLNKSDLHVFVNDRPTRGVCKLKYCLSFVNQPPYGSSHLRRPAVAQPQQQRKTQNGDNVRNPQNQFDFLQYQFRIIWFTGRVREGVSPYSPLLPNSHFTIRTIIMNIKLLTPGILLSAMLLTTGIASAASLFTENFDYSLGSLIGQGNWGDGGGGSGQATVQDPTLSPYVHGGLQVPTVGNEIRISNKVVFKMLENYTPHNDGDTVFISFLAKMDAGSNQYGGIQLKNTSTGRLMLIGQLWTSPYWGMNVEGAGIPVVETRSAVSNASTSLLLTQITYTSASTADIHLYVNPVVSNLEGAISLVSSPVASLTGVSLDGGFDQILMRGTNSTPIIDAIRIGTNLGDVVTPIPEASSYAMILACCTSVAWMASRKTARRKAR